MSTDRVLHLRVRGRSNEGGTQQSASAQSSEYDRIRDACLRPAFAAALETDRGFRDVDFKNDELMSVSRTGILEDGGALLVKR